MIQMVSIPFFESSTLPGTPFHEKMRRESESERVISTAGFVLLYLWSIAHEGIPEPPENTCSTFLLLLSFLPPASLLSGSFSPEHTQMLLLQSRKHAHVQGHRGAAKSAGGTLSCKLAAQKSTTAFTSLNVKLSLTRQSVTDERTDFNSLSRYLHF